MKTMPDLENENKTLKENISEKDSIIQSKDKLIESKDERIRKLENLVKQFQQHRFGSSSEKLTQEQVNLFEGSILLL